MILRLAVISSWVAVRLGSADPGYSVMTMLPAAVALGGGPRAARRRVRVVFLDDERTAAAGGKDRRGSGTGGFQPAVLIAEIGPAGRLARRAPAPASDLTCLRHAIALRARPEAHELDRQPARPVHRRQARMAVGPLRAPWPKAFPRDGRPWAGIEFGPSGTGTVELVSSGLC